MEEQIIVVLFFYQLEEVVAVLGSLVVEHHSHVAETRADAHQRSFARVGRSRRRRRFSSRLRLGGSWSFHCFFSSRFIGAFAAGGIAKHEESGATREGDIQSFHGIHFFEGHEGNKGTAERVNAYEQMD